MELLRYVLFGIEIYLMVRLFRKIALEYIFNQELYAPRQNQKAPTPARQEIVVSTEKKAC